MIPIRITNGKWIVYRCAKMPIQSREGYKYPSNYCGIFDSEKEAKEFIKRGYKK